MLRDDPKKNPTDQNSTNIHRIQSHALPSPPMPKLPKNEEEEEKTANKLSS